MLKNSQTYFTKVADQWDEIRSGYFTEHMRASAIAKANLPENATVADIGTGTGFVIAGLAPHTAKVYGFDANTDMLVVAQKNLASLNNVELHISKGDLRVRHRRLRSLWRPGPRPRALECAHRRSEAARSAGNGRLRAGEEPAMLRLARRLGFAVSPDPDDASVRVCRLPLAEA